MDKIPMKYRIVTSTNPVTGVTTLRPIITGRSTMTLRQLIEYAKNASYVRGQTRDLEGLLNGFIQAMQDRAKAGYSINVKDWFIINGRLRGKVDETGRITDANSYHVSITSAKDLRVDIDSFSWQLVGDDGKNVKIMSVASPNGRKNEVVKTRSIVVGCKNGVFNAAWGDEVKVAWKDAAGESHELALTPSEQSETYLRFDWPTGLANVADGTQLAFTFRLHGKEGGTVKLSELTADLVPAPTDISDMFED